MASSYSEKSAIKPYQRYPVRILFFHLLVLSIISLCITLGFWQLERSNEKARMLEQIRQGYQQPASAQQMADAIEQERVANYSHYYLRGRFHPEYSFILDNRTYQGRAGYHLLTLFELLPDTLATDQSQWILINRGWIAAPRLRSERPTYQTPQGIHQLQVQLVQPHPVDKTEQLDLKWPVRIQWLDLHQLSGLTEKSLLQYEFRLIDAHQPGVQIAQPAAPALLPAQHTGYAVQWFSLAGVLFMVWGYYHLPRPGWRSRQSS